MGRRIREHGAAEGMRRFADSDAYRQLQAESLDMAQTLLAQFQKPDAEATTIKFERIAADAPLEDLGQLAQIAVPSLVLANRRDPVYPFGYAEILARRIVASQLREITAKAVSTERHAADIQQSVSKFLRRHFA